MIKADNDNDHFEMIHAKRGWQWVVRIRKNGKLWAAGVHKDKRQAFILATQEAQRNMEAGL